MDKLKKVLSGQDDNIDDVNILQGFKTAQQHCCRKKRNTNFDLSTIERSLYPKLGNTCEGFRCLFRSWGGMFNTGDMFAVAAENWVGSVCCLVYFWERRLPDQHNVPDGAPEAAEEDVRENQGFRHRHYADMPCADPVCCLLVEEQWPCVAVLHFAILGFGLVWLVLYSLCKGCGDKDVLPLPEVSSLSTHSVPLQLPPCFWTTKRPLCFLAQSNDTGATPAGTSSTSLRNGL